MSISSLFDAALHVVLNSFQLFEYDLRYLPANVKTKVAQRMGKRGYLNDRNAALVSRLGAFPLKGFPRATINHAF